MTETDGHLTLGNRQYGEKLGEREIDYSLKYARMYGGDLQGIKEKIPYMKELGINAVWLNPVFFLVSEPSMEQMTLDIFRQILGQ